MQIVGGAEVLEVLHSHKELGTFVQSFYNCQYDVFFRMLGALLASTRLSSQSLKCVCLCSVGGGSGQARPVPGPALPVLHSGDADQGLLSAAGVLSFAVTAGNGRHIWCHTSLY